MNYQKHNQGFTHTPIWALFIGSDRARRLSQLRARISRLPWVSFYKNRTMPNLVSGFTVAELVVVIAIMVIITGAVLSKYRNYGYHAQFANAAENIVLALRQAQVYGVGVKGNAVACGGATTFDCSYGVYFSIASPYSLTIFVDVNNNGVFDAAASPTEVYQTLSWVAPIRISSLMCDGAACGSNVLSILFKRPDPDAAIRAATAALYNKGAITITDGTNTSIITLTKTGQISLQ